MNMTPVHPYLDYDRALTPDEMLEALAYEGMFGIGERDLPVAQKLDNEGKLYLDHSDVLGWSVIAQD